MNFFEVLFTLLVSLPCVLFLIYLSLKYGGAKLGDLQNGRYIKILERVPVSKDNSLIVAKFGEGAYVLSSSSKGVEIIKEIPAEELAYIETQKTIPDYKNLKDFYNNIILKRKKKDD